MKDRVEPKLKEMQSGFQKAVAAQGGLVIDLLHAKDRLYARATIPVHDFVGPGDRMQRGVAMRASLQEARINPYLFRALCRNGHILPIPMGAHRLENIHFHEDGETAYFIREAVDSCCAEEVFSGALERIRQARKIVDPLNGNPAIRHFLAHQKYYNEIKRRLEAEGGSLFGLMNAITSLARDVEDPELQWTLEELGGRVPLESIAALPSGRGAASIEAEGRFS